MATVLRNFLRFTNLVVGVPSVRAHGLQIDRDSVGAIALTPQVALVNPGPFTVAIDATNVTVTRLPNSPGASVDVWVEWRHSIDQVWPSTGVPAGLPLIAQSGNAGAVDPERTIYVSPSGGDVATIEAGITAALALVPPVSAAAPASLLVFPGSYAENPLSVPAGLAVIGQGATSCMITAVDDTASLVTLAPSSRIVGVSIMGADNGGVGIDCTTGAAGQAALARDVQVIDCTTGVRATGATTVLFLLTAAIVRTPAGNMTTGILAAAGANLRAITPQVFGITPVTIADGVRATGPNTVVDLYSLDIQNCVAAITAASTAEIHCMSGKIDNCATQFHIEATSGEIHSTGIDADNISTYGLWIEAATGDFQGIGNSIRSDQLSIAAGATVLSAHISEFAGDLAQMILGELAVGLPNLPAELIVGEGDSHVRGMRVLRNTNGEAGAWSDITTEMASASGSTAVAFPGVGAANCLYVGGNEKQFPGLKINTTVAIVPGGGSIIWEYWNGAAWTQFRLMTADQALPYASYAEDTFGRVAFEQVRFNASNLAGWAQKALNGYTRWWVRCRIAVGITTSPTLEQIKLHTNRFEVNGDAVPERFGTGITERPIIWHKNLMDTFTGGGAPGNNNQALTANITIAAQQNVLADNQIEGLAGLFTIPQGLDTSQPVTLSWLYILKAAGAGAAVEFEGHFGQLELDDILAGGVGDTAWNEIVDVNTFLQNQLKQAETTFDVCDLVPGEFVAFSLFRDARAGNVHDTLAANVELVAVDLRGWFWR